MGVEAQQVQIVINVVDENSGRVLKNILDGFGGVGNAGAGAGEKVSRGMKQISSHSLTALDNVRLLRDDLGVRIPRSMEKAIASSKFLMSGISAIGTGLLAIGAVDIGIRIGRGLYEAYEKWISLNSAAEEYRKQVEKAKDEDFIKVRDIETATARINDATNAARSFKRVSEDMRSSMWREIAAGLATGGVAGGFTALAQGTYGARQLADQGYKKQTQADALRPELAALHHQEILDAIELSHAADGRLRGEQKITAEKNKQHAIDEETRKYEAALSAMHGNATPGTAGASRQRTHDAIADAKAEAELFNLRRQQAHELQAIREQALEAGLRGSELLHAQEAAAIEDLKFKDLDSVAARKAVHDKFHAEELRKIQDETRETEKQERAAAAAGLTGVPKIQAETENRVADIHDEDFYDPATAARRRAAIRREGNQQILAAEEEFTQRIRTLADESAAHQVEGFARIRAEGQKQIDELRHSYEQLYGKNPNAPEYQKHIGELNRGVGIIDASTADQTADLARKNADETGRIEAEARAKYLSSEKQQTAAIQTEYEERLQRFKEQLDQQQISEEDYNRRVIAAGQLRDAQLVESARQAREKMAGEFTRFFRNPTEALKEMGEKAAGEAAAAMVQRVQGRLTGTHASGGFNDQWSLGGIFNKISGVPRAAGSTGTAAHGLDAVKAIALASAEIRVQNANVAFSGGFSGAGGGGGLVGGSTSLLGMSGSAFGAAGGSTASPSSPGIGTAGAGSSFSVGGGSTVNNAIGDVQQSIGLFKQAKGIFGGGANSAGGGDDDGSLGGSGMLDINSVFGSSKTNVVGPSGSNGGMLGGGGMMANLGGAAGGAMGLYSAYQGNGGFGGALGGAMSGMELGMAIGGPAGAAVGAAAGAILGAIGFGGREKARVYDLKTVRPRLTGDFMSYQAGSMDYTSAYSDMQALDAEARKTLDKMGGSARAYYWDTVNKEIHQAEAKLTGEQRAGRSKFTATAAQYDIGADRIPRDGFAFIHQDERIMPSDNNERITRALEAGADERITRVMDANPGPTVMPAQTGFGGDVHLHVHAMDTKGVKQFLDHHKHDIRAALNASYGENSGGADYA